MYTRHEMLDIVMMKDKDKNGNEVGEAKCRGIIVP